MEAMSRLTNIKADITKVVTGSLTLTVAEMTIESQQGAISCRNPPATRWQIDCVALFILEGIEIHPQKHRHRFLYGFAFPAHDSSPALSCLNQQNVFHHHGTPLDKKLMSQQRRATISSDQWN
jgi:hypothetical protein